MLQVILLAQLTLPQLEKINIKDEMSFFMIKSTLPFVNQQLEK